MKQKQFMLTQYLGGGGGGSNPIFPQDTPKFGFGDGQKWGKKYMEREGNKLSIFKKEKIPIFFP